MKTYSLFDKPLKVYGVPFFEQTKSLRRLPKDLIPRLTGVEYITARRCPGARVEFKTDSPSFTVKVSLKTLVLDIGMSLYSGQGAQVMVGERGNAQHLALVYPPNYDTKVYQRTFSKSADLEQVTIYFPRNELVENIEVTVEDGAIVTEPTPYKYQKPVVFYGSSITEGGCACNTMNAYSAILSRWLDFDFYNMGFSGSARGELIMADYLNTLGMGAFVYDYDFNAISIEELSRTHKPFFDRIRDGNPNIPILIMTRPAAFYNDYAKARREIIKATYNAAVAAGDKNVYFIDGETFFGEEDRNLCTIDNLHPNDLGFYRMACAIRPVLKKMLESTI